MASAKSLSKVQRANRVYSLFHSIRELLVLQALVPATCLAILSYLFSFLTPRPRFFDPNVDVPDLGGKVVFVTGASAGLGKETVLQLAKYNPEKIHLAARDAKKAETAIAEIKAVVPEARIVFIKLDLMSFSSINRTVACFARKNSRLDLLVLNAGIMATPFATSTEGYEAQFATNYLGHALLTKLLLKTMLKTASLPDTDVRTISVSSIGHHMAPSGGILFDEDQVRAQSPWRLYGQSKLANILHVQALAKMFPQITSVAVHPGLIATDLYTPSMNSTWLVRMGMKMFAPLVFADTAYGALNQLWAATAPTSGVESGAYYMPVGKKMGASRYATDEELAARLWDWTEEQFEKHGASDGALV